VRVRPWVELIGVESVEDAAESLAPDRKHRFEAFAVLRCEDFTGVGGTHGGHDVAVVNRLGKEVVQFIRAAIAEVVDREDGRDTPQAGLTPAHVAQGEGEWRRVPIVQMDDIRHPFVLLQHLDDRTAEELVPEQIIRFAVNAGAAEVVAFGDEVDRHAAGAFDGCNVDLTVLARERHDVASTFG
jgi:hypothetical protein